MNLMSAGGIFLNENEASHLPKISHVIQYFKYQKIEPISYVFSLTTLSYLFFFNFADVSYIPITRGDRQCAIIYCIYYYYLLIKYYFLGKKLMK